MRAFWRCRPDSTERCFRFPQNSRRYNGDLSLMKISGIASVILSSILLLGCGGEDKQSSKETAETSAERATDQAEKKPAALESEAPTPEETGAAEPINTAQAVDAPSASADEPPQAFRQCAVCHAISPDAAPMVGPTLVGVYGVTAANQPNFAYSKALQESGIVWTEENLLAFIENPQKFIPGNRMAYVGERNAERRQAIVDFLKTLDAE